VIAGPLSNRLSAILLAAIMAAGFGCSTCISVEATYDEAWRATRDALLLEPHMTRADPVQSYEEGTFRAVVERPEQRDELHYFIEIKPAGGTEPQTLKVCVQVRALDALPGDGPRVEAQRRSDLEAMITARIERALGTTDEIE
jgi:hypothetical protein